MRKRIALYAQHMWWDVVAIMLSQGAAPPVRPLSSPARGSGRALPPSLGSDIHDEEYPNDYGGVKSHCGLHGFQRRDAKDCEAAREHEARRTDEREARGADIRVRLQHRHVAVEVRERLREVVEELRER